MLLKRAVNKLAVLLPARIEQLLQSTRPPQRFLALQHGQHHLLVRRQLVVVVTARRGRFVEAHAEDVFLRRDTTLATAAAATTSRSRSSNSSNAQGFEIVAVCCGGRTKREKK